MKLFGRTIAEPSTDFIVFPRRIEGQDVDIVLTARALMDEDKFMALCPHPKAPKVMRVGQTEYHEDTTDKHYIAAVQTWGEQKMAWIVLESLKATPKEMLEWETVQYDQPSTWKNWKDELKAAFFTDHEIGAIMGLVWGVNGVSQVRLDEARLRFLAGHRRVFNEPLSPTDEHKSTQSGEPVKDSISGHPASDGHGKILSPGIKTS